jgi:hypothetical protein
MSPGCTPAWKNLRANDRAADDETPPSRMQHRIPAPTSRPKPIALRNTTRDDRLRPSSLGAPNRQAIEAVCSIRNGLFCARRELRETQPGQLTSQPMRMRRQRARHPDPCKTSMIALLSVRRKGQRRATGRCDYADIPNTGTPATSAGRAASA